MGVGLGRSEFELRSFLGSISGVESEFDVRFSRLDGVVLQIGRFWCDFVKNYVDPGIFGGDFLESGFPENGWGEF